MLNFQNLKKPILALAPMAGISDSAFRRLCREEGADLVYSEMASVSALFFKAERTMELLRVSEAEQPYVVQLFGKEPEHFARAAALVSQGIPVIRYKGLLRSMLRSKGEARKKKPKLVRPAGLDINFGCPARKVFGHGSGAALMDQPQLARKIIEAVVANTPLPVSIKVRTEVKGVKLMDFLREIEINKLGVSLIMVHGRTYDQGFSGPVDFATIKAVKKYFKGLVLANGGIRTLADGRKMLKETGADGLGIATGAYGQPDLFRELATLKKAGAMAQENAREPEKIIKNASWAARKSKLAQKHANYVFQLKGSHGILEMRKHLVWYFKGLPGIKKLHAEMVRVENLADILKILNKVEKLSKSS